MHAEPMRPPDPVISAFICSESIQISSGLQTKMAQHINSFIQALAAREEFRERYSRYRDPIREDRMLWRAQSLRHIVHLLPGESILELGSGANEFTRQLHKVTRGENLITAVTFRSGRGVEASLPSEVEHLRLESFPGTLEGRTFDVIVGIDMMDERNCAALLQRVFQFLKPGGQMIFYESNPWNPVLKLRRTVLRLLGRKDTRKLLSRPRLYELLSEIGFTKILAVYNDFVYAPLNRPLVWLLRNLSILLENVPGVQTLAGSILLYAQKPGMRAFAAPPLYAHAQLRRAVSVVVPCHNEDMNLRPLVLRLVGLYREYLHEIILVDDNSTDSTADVIRALSMELPS